MQRGLDPGQRGAITRRQRRQQPRLDRPRGGQDLVQNGAARRRQRDLDQPAIALRLCLGHQPGLGQPRHRPADARLFHIDEAHDVAHRHPARAAQMHQHPPFGHGNAMRGLVIGGQPAADAFGQNRQPIGQKPRQFKAIMRHRALIRCIGNYIDFSPGINDK